MNEITKPEEQETALAVSQAELDAAFGGPDASTPIEVAWPEIKMTKTDEFKMPDGTKVKEIICNIAYTQRSRSYWAKDFDGENTPPDCASDDSISPTTGDNRQCENKKNLPETCSNCKQSKWQEVEKDGKIRNAMLCSQSLNMILMLQGKGMPYVMRVRSTSIGKKSSIATFFLNCIERGVPYVDDETGETVTPEEPPFALGQKYQTVKVKLTLKELKINNFETSVLEVTKVGKLSVSDPLLPSLISLYKKATEEFVVKHQRDDAASSDDSPFAKEEPPVQADDDMPEGFGDDQAEI